MRPEYQIVDNQHMLQTGGTLLLEDFDSVKQIQSQEYFLGERKLFHNIMEHLRSGQLFKIQN